MSGKTAGVVVLYRPEDEVINNISTYAHMLDKLYLIDNSEQPSQSLITALKSKYQNVEYIHLLYNQGIAKALNTAAFKAVEEGYDWLLTMDQDSKASENMVERLFQVFDNYPPQQLGIIAPKYLQQTDTFEIIGSGLQEADVVITSGNLLNLKAFLKVGSFREDFFIDYVDHEYCLRLRLAGYKIIINNSVLLYHELGDSKNHRLIGKNVIASHHSHLRRYYITRNRLAVLKEYKSYFPDYYREQRTLNIRELIKLVFFEKDKFNKIKSVYRGYRDFRHSKFGKYIPE